MCYNKDTPKGDIKKKEVKTMFEMQIEKVKELNAQKEKVLVEVKDFLEKTLNECCQNFEIRDNDNDKITSFEVWIEDGVIRFDWGVEY